MTQQTYNWKPVVVALIAGLLVVSAVAAVLYYNTTIHAGGTIATRTIGCSLFFDAAGTQPISQISWGVLEPGSAVNITVYLKNTGNIPVNFTAGVNNWNPAASANYISVTFDFKGAINVQSTVIIPCIVSQYISPSTPSNITSYGYDVTFTAMGV